MQANKRNLSEILSQHIRLVAPLFQRPYVWNKDQNWEQLWFTLLEVADRRLSGKPPRPYFMGALVLDQVPTAIGSVPTRVIIDGQQRMTTLQVLMRAASDVFNSCGYEYEATIIQKFIFNTLREESDDQFKVWPTNIDRSDFRTTMKGIPSQGLIGQAYCYFQNEISEWLAEDPHQSATRASALLELLQNDLVFVAIDLDNDDDGQLIFETLNALGTPLLPSDLVKNLLFRQAIAEGLDTELLYATYWAQFEEKSNYWREVIGVGRRKRPRLDLYLQHFLAYTLGKEPLLPHQFRDFRNALRDGELGNTEEALAHFSGLAKLYRDFDLAPSNSPAGSLRLVLDVLDSSVIQPLVLGIVANADSAQIDAMMQTLESYLMRRTLCSLTTKNLNQLSADAVNHLREHGWTNEILRNYLLTASGPSRTWPTDEDIIEFLTSRAAYFTIPSRRLAYTLSRIEASLRTGKSELPWNTNAELVKGLSIEHLIPQKWEKNWPLPAGLTWETERRRREMVNRLGNLTILTQKLNSSISHAAWDRKRTSLKNHTVLLMNTYLAEQEYWNEELVESRTAHLAQLICTIWPR